MSLPVQTAREADAQIREVGQMVLASMWTCPRNHHAFLVVDSDTIEAELQSGDFPRPHCNACGQRYDLSSEDRQALQAWVADEMRPPICAVCGCPIDEDGGWRLIQPNLNATPTEVRFVSLCARHLAERDEADNSN